jgi:quaternary ammonium compound-resistance protein SugE
VKHLFHKRCFIFFIKGVSSFKAYIFSLSSNIKKAFMAWIYLVIAGFFEIGFTTFLKLSDNFTRLWPTVCFFILSVFSFLFLSFSLKEIPLGTAYAVWTGIGAFGTVLIGIFYFGEATDPWRLFFIFCLIFSIIGLKTVSI